MVMDQMVGVVRLEDLVMDDGVGAKGILEAAKRPVHQKFVNGPLEKRAINDSGGEANDCPEPE